MRNVIEELVKIFNEAESIDVAASVLSSKEKRFSKHAAKIVMLDVKDYIEETISESQLSLFLRSHGY